MGRTPVLDARPECAPSRGPQPIVVKLGGAVIRSAELRPWLNAIGRTGCPTIIVPGGGALADEVRTSQRGLGFSDDAAHRMALLAMDQLAWAVAGAVTGLRVADSGEALDQILDAGLLAVWAPYRMIANRADITASWAITSDSLALWLAGQLGAPACYIVKAAARPAHATSAHELARLGIVDEAFPEYLKQSGVHAFLLGPGDQDAFVSSVPGQTVGAPIDLA